MTDFFKKRLVSHQKKMMKYLRYVFNDHFVLVCLFLLGGIGVYYSNLIKSLPTGFTPGILVCIIFWLGVLTMGKFASLTKAADSIFLLPKEKEMRGYLQSAFRYSCLFPFVLLFLASGFSMPLVVLSTHASFSDFFWYVGILWLLKASNLEIQRMTFFDYSTRKRTMWKYLWYSTTIICLSGSLFFTPLFGMLFAILQFGWFHLKLWIQNPQRLNWDQMIQFEEQRLKRMYQFINLFTDVPEVATKVKRRKYLDPFVQEISRRTNNTYLYLYVRRIVRGSEFSGLFVRLVCIAVVLLHFASSIYISVGLSILFLYLIGFQLLPLYDQFQYQLMVQLYPINEKQKLHALQKIIGLLLGSAAILFGVSSGIVLPMNEKLLPLIINSIFVLLFIKWYLPARIKK